jgi:hypothetical protein
LTFSPNGPFLRKIGETGFEDENLTKILVLEPITGNEKE